MTKLTITNTINSSISKGCVGIQPGYYVCVGTGSMSTSVSITPTPASPTATPSATSKGSSTSGPHSHQQVSQQIVSYNSICRYGLSQLCLLDPVDNESRQQVALSGILATISLCGVSWVLHCFFFPIRSLPPSFYYFKSA